MNVTSKVKEAILFLPGPTASKYLDAAIKDVEDSTGKKAFIATVNAGYELLMTLKRRHPTTYMVIESPAVSCFFRQMKATALGGNDLWTWPSRVGDCHGFSDLVRSVPWGHGKKFKEARKNNQYSPNLFGHATTVGVTMMQALIDIYKVKKLRIVGCDGYTLDNLYDEHVDHRPLEPVDQERCDRLNRLGAEYIDQMMNHPKNADVEFLFYGKPVHALETWRGMYITHYPTESENESDTLEIGDFVPRKTFAFDSDTIAALNNAEVESVPTEDVKVHSLKGAVITECANGPIPDQIRAQMSKDRARAEEEMDGDH